MSVEIKFPVCPECGGSGKIVDPKRILPTDPPKRVESPCSSCVEGVVITDELVKIAKLAAMAEGQSIKDRGERLSLTERNDRMARASLTAAIRHMKRTR